VLSRLPIRNRRTSTLTSRLDGAAPPDPAGGRDDERLDGGIWEWRNAADVDFTEHVTLFAGDRRLAVQEIAVPKQRQFVWRMPTLRSSSGTHLGLEALPEALQMRNAGRVVQPLTRRRRLPDPSGARADEARSPLATRSPPRGPDQVATDHAFVKRGCQAWSIM
jgi:hypothetical protein